MRQLPGICDIGVFDKKCVSIIIPIYNVEKYVEKCVSSVLGQTYKDIEIVLVNDGSTDNSRNIIEQYASLDNCKIVDKPNAGLASARNIGLSVCSGDFVYFLDADDYIDKNAISSLVDYILKSDSDFCCHRISYVDETYTKFDIAGDDYDFSISADKDEIIKEALLIRNIKTAVTVKLWRRDFIERNHLRFLEGVIHEDILFSVTAALYAKKVAFLNEVLYFALRRSSSTSRNIKARNLTDYFILFDKMKDNLIKCSCWDKYEDYYYACYFKCLLFTLFVSVYKFEYLNDYKAFFKILSGSIYFNKDKGKYLNLLSSKYYWIYKLSLYPTCFYRVVLICRGLGISVY